MEIKVFKTVIKMQNFHTIHVGIYIANKYDTNACSPFPNVVAYWLMIITIYNIGTRMVACTRLL